MIEPIVAALKARREFLGWEPVKLAHMLHWSPSHIIRFEQEGGNPRLGTARRVAEALGCELVLAPKPNVRVSHPGGIWPKT